MMHAEKDPKCLYLTLQQQAFIEKNGLYFEKTCGVPRIAGRIVGLLMIVPQPLTIKTIGETLIFSHGSISTNLRVLQLLGLVEKVTLTGDRCDYYRFSTHAWDEILTKRVENIRELRVLAVETLQDFKPEGLVLKRFEEMLAWVNLACLKYDEMVSEWRAREIKSPEDNRLPDE